MPVNTGTGVTETSPDLSSKYSRKNVHDPHWTFRLPLAGLKRRSFSVSRVGISRKVVLGHIGIAGGTWDILPKVAGPMIGIAADPLHILPAHQVGERTSTASLVRLAQLVRAFSDGMQREQGERLRQPLLRK
jgi:hypothetical protein